MSTVLERCTRCGEDTPEDEVVIGCMDEILCSDCAKYEEEVYGRENWMIDEDEEEFWGHEDPD